MESTQTVQITTSKKEDGVPIYETNVNPISFSRSRRSIKKEEVEKVSVRILYPR